MISAVAANTVKSVAGEKTTRIVSAAFFIILGLVVVFVLWKFLSGIKRVTDVIADEAPISESAKLEIITKPTYADNIRYLEPTTGITAIVKGGYKTVSAYEKQKGISAGLLGDAAEAIYNAKWPGYISSSEVYNAIASMPSKAAVSLLAFTFNNRYASKFSTGNLSVFLGKYLKVPEMENVTKIINEKPVL